VTYENYKPAIVFDFGNVLLPWDPRFLYRKLFNGNERKMERFLSEIEFSTWNKYQDAGRSFADGVEDLCNRYPQHCELIRAYDERYEESLGNPIWSVIDILDTLREENYELFGLTNWSAEKFNLVRNKYPFFHWFEDIVVSGEVRYLKPDTRIFQVLLDRIGRPAQECLFIDDSPVNVKAAQQIGFDTIQFHSGDQLLIEFQTRRILLDKSNKKSG